MEISGINAAQVKELREKSGAGVMECKRALEEACGDMESALRILREKGISDAKRREQKEAKQGAIDCYIHIGRQIGAMVELNCETDFVARNSEFLEVAHLIALQVAACNPIYLRRDLVPEAVIEEQKEIFKKRCISQGKPEKVWGKIIEGLLDKFYQEVCLLEQPFVKDPSISVNELIAQASSRLGEKIAVRRFARFQVGQEEEE